MERFRTTRRFKATVALSLSLIIAAVGIGLGKPMKASAAPDYSSLINYTTTEDLEQRRRERDEAMAQAQAAANRVSELSAQQYELEGELEVLNGLSEEQREQYDLISGQLAAALVAKAEALDAYVRAQDDLANKQLQFAERISVMFEYRNQSYLEILLQSDSIAGFFTNMEIISLIGEADSQMVQELKTAVENASMQAEIALKEADDLEEIIQQKQAQLDELEARIGVTTAALEDVQTQISGWQQMEDELEAYSQALTAQIAALQAQIAAENAATATTTTANATTSPSVDTNVNPSDSSEGAVETGSGSEQTQAPTATPVPTPTTPPTSNNSLSWPTWTNYITSYYGNRVHPIYGTTRFHSGIDIGAGFGSTIMAAASGTVISVSQPVPGQDWGGSGYGNYCIIDHGNGLSTLYAHARSISVSVGDYVSAGQAIGVVGSTGSSTGAHLHFEVRINGSTVDPLGYLP